MSEPFWNVSFLVLLFFWICIRQYYGHGTMKEKAIKSKQPQLEKFLVILNFPALAVIPIIIIFSKWLDFASMGLPNWIRLVAWFMLVLNLGLFLWCHKTLGRNWSMVLEIRKDHKLIINGPYKYVRHPMYTHFWSLMIFQGIMLDNWIQLAYGIITWGILYFLRIKQEEKMMTEEFGDEYIEYITRTWRLVPKIL